MAIAPAMQRYQGDSRNGLSESGIADANGTLLTSANAAVKVSITRVSDGVLLAAGVTLPYSGVPGTFTLAASSTQASWFPGNDTITIVYTVTDQTGMTVLITKTVPGRPEPPAYMSYGRLSRRPVTLSPQALVGAASAQATFLYRSGMTQFGPAVMAGSAAPFSLVVDAPHWPAGDVITILLAATDTLGLAFTQVIVAQDTGD